MSANSLTIETIALNEVPARLESGDWFFVLDACDQPAVPELAQQMGGELAISLYRGWTETYYWAIAPYLFRANTAFHDWISQNLAGTPWGIAIQTSAELPALRRHLRRFLQVRLPDRRKVFFRFYDPRPLPTFLESSSPEQRSAFFGPIKSVVCPGKEAWVSYSLSSAESVRQPRIMDISPSQMQALDEHMDASFLHRMVDHLSSTFPDETASFLSELPKRTQRVIREAQQYGIEYEHEIQQYLELAIKYPNQMKNPKPGPIEELLTYPNRPAERKLRFLAEELALQGDRS